MSNRLRSKERNVTSYSDDITESSFSQLMYIDYNLNEDETLHTLSMKFGVSIPDLKRINSLQNDRDIYALKLVKIPIKANSIHSEKYANQLKYASSQISRLTINGLLNDNSEATNNISPESEDDKSLEDFNTIAAFSQNGDVTQQSDFNATHQDYDSDKYKSTTSLLRDQGTELTKASKSNNQAKEAKRFFKKLDNNLESLKNQNNELVTVVKGAQDTDVEQLVHLSNSEYSVEKRCSKKGKNGLFTPNVRDILVLACVVVVLLPLIIFVYRFLYIKEHPNP